MKKKHIISRPLAILLGVVVLLVVIRLILPYVVLKYANKTLATMDGYRGHVNDIDIALIRGAYTIDSVYLNKFDSASNKQTPFFGAKKIDLAVEWPALFKGSLVGNVIFNEPTLRFTKDKVEPDELKKDSADFIKLLEDFMPLNVNRVEVVNGSMQFIDESSKPRVDIKMTNTNVVALNLRNAYDSTTVLPASIKADAKVYGGTLDYSMKLNPLARTPTFDMNATLQNTDLTQLNDFLQAYAKIDVNKGTFGLYTEAAGKDGKFKGYVKPIIKDLDVLGKEDRDDNIFRKIWEGFTGTIAKALENRKEDQVATKIPFEGSIDDPQANVWYTIRQILQNAFIQALLPSIEGEINLAAVNAEEIKNKEKKGFFKKVFGGKEEKENEKESGKEKRERKKNERESEKVE